MASQRGDAKSDAKDLNWVPNELGAFKESPQADPSAFCRREKRGRKGGKKGEAKMNPRVHVELIEFLRSLTLQSWIFSFKKRR